MPSMWGCMGTYISGADGIIIGTGQQNTIDIINGCSTPGIAARVCDDLVLGGYSDWYLPSKDELHQLYLNKVAIGGFPTNTIYLSSTEFDDVHAWIEHFDTGSQYTVLKDGTVTFRAVRSFSQPINTDTTNSVMVSTSGWNFVTVTDSLGCTATDSVYVHIDICGCTDSTAINYNPSATSDDGSCIATVFGCMDSTMLNYNSLANTDDGSCIAFVYGCMDSTATNYDSIANTDDGSCTNCYAIADIGVDTIVACDSILLSTNTITNGTYNWQMTNASISQYCNGQAVS